MIGIDNFKRSRHERTCPSSSASKKPYKRVGEKEMQAYTLKREE